MKDLKQIKLELIEELASLLDKNSDELDSSLELHELGVDSLGLVELFVFIEKQFSIKLMESGITQDDLRTIDALASKIAEEINS